MAVFDSPTKTRITRAAARIDPSSRGFVLATAVIGILSFGAAFLVSGSSMLWAGREIGLAWPVMLALSIDLPMIAFALAALSRRARGQGTRSSMAWLLGFSAASVAVNAWHSLSLGHAGINLVGSLFLAVAVPAAILGTSEQLLSVLVAPPVHDAERLQREARAADRTAAAPVGAASRPRKGTAEYADRQADIKDRKATPGGVSNAALAREGFSMTEITGAAST